MSSRPPLARLRVKCGDTVEGEQGEPCRTGDQIAILGDPRDMNVPDLLQVGNFNPPWWVQWVSACSVMALLAPPKRGSWELSPAWGIQQRGRWVDGEEVQGGDPYNLLKNNERASYGWRCICCC